jgi:hypothetical protein
MKIFYLLLRRPSEPILFPKVRIQFADFPYLHSSKPPEAANLGDLMRIWVRSGAETKSIKFKKKFFFFFARLGFSRANNDTSDTTGNAVLYGIKVTSLVEISFSLGVSLLPKEKEKNKRRKKKKRKKLVTVRLEPFLRLNRLRGRRPLKRRENSFRARCRRLRASYTLPSRYK